MTPAGRSALCALIASVLGVAPAAQEAPLDPSAPPDNPAMSLLRSSMSPPETTMPATDLEVPAARLRAMRFLPRVVVSPQPVETPSALRPTATASAPATHPAYQVVTPHTLAQLKAMAPAGLANPLKLGDALFVQGQREAALVCYETALRQDENSPDKAWLLFQVGACRFEGQPQAALDAFERVVQECAGSPYVEQAQAQQRLIRFRLANNLVKAPAAGTPATAGAPATRPASMPTTGTR